MFYLRAESSPEGPNYWEYPGNRENERAFQGWVWASVCLWLICSCRGKKWNIEMRGKKEKKRVGTPEVSNTAWNGRENEPTFRHKQFWGKATLVLGDSPELSTVVALARGTLIKVQCQTQQSGTLRWVVQPTEERGKTRSFSREWRSAS